MSKIDQALQRQQQVNVIHGRTLTPETEKRGGTLRLDRPVIVPHMYGIPSGKLLVSMLSVEVERTIWPKTEEDHEPWVAVSAFGKPLKDDETPHGGMSEGWFAMPASLAESLMGKIATA
jgi:hypothetical protein